MKDTTATTPAQDARQETFQREVQRRLRRRRGPWLAELIAARRGDWLERTAILKGRDR